MKRLLMLVLIGAGQCSSQTVQPLLQPRQTFTAPGGFPCANCLLYSYAAGSTTPLDTYSDSTGLVRNQNPVPLDSSGSASIWTGNNSYKFVLKTADGTPVWTVDNVTGLISGSGGGGSMVYPGSGIPVSTGAAWSASLTAPSGALVGTTDTQALTNKTLDGVSPTTMGYVDPTSSYPDAAKRQGGLGGGYHSQRHVMRSQLNLHRGGFNQSANHAHRQRARAFCQCHRGLCRPWQSACRQPE
jgi:hypothetical protein